jgi:hypothetical protein
MKNRAKIIAKRKKKKELKARASAKINQMDTSLQDNPLKNLQGSEENGGQSWSETREYERGVYNDPRLDEAPRLRVQVIEQPTLSSMLLPHVIAAMKPLDYDTRVCGRRGLASKERGLLCDRKVPDC